MCTALVKMKNRQSLPLANMFQVDDVMTGPFTVEKWQPRKSSGQTSPDGNGFCLNMCTADIIIVVGLMHSFRSAPVFLKRGDVLATMDLMR